MITYRARYSCGYSSVRRARLFIIGVAARCGFDACTLTDIESAAGEGLANAAEHGDRDAQTGFAVCVTFDGVRFTIDIKDNGAGFDTDAVVAASPDTSGGRGLGIFLMQSLMDDVAYSDRGTRIRLSISRFGLQPR
jgi:serine/threonine-protein kinase RsbW